MADKRSTRRNDFVFKLASVVGVGTIFWVRFLAGVLAPTQIIKWLWLASVHSFDGIVIFKSTEIGCAI